MSAHQFLLEVRCEEIPANALPGAREQLAARFAAELGEAGMGGCTVTALSTVRRLVVHVDGLPERQADREEEVTGPPVKAAFTQDGSPLPAAVGFARAHGVAVDALRVVKGAKGDVIAATRRIAGRPAPEVLAEIAPRVVAALHFPKRMRWGAGEHEYVRPVHGVVALFGAKTLDQVVPLRLFGVTAGSTTVGHRVIAPAEIEVAGAAGLAAYRTSLAQAGVLLDAGERRAQLDARIAALAAEVGCEVRPDPGLLSELVELVEFPGAVRGAIEERFLELPEEVLITTLRHHQKTLVLAREGRVAPYFIAAADRADDPEGLVRQGNEWVCGARLADAAFFFAHDRQRPLAECATALERLTFHQALGSFAAKSDAVDRLAGSPPFEALGVARSADLRRAIQLAKADLTTAMVAEFSELQGVMGGIYARLDGESAAVWQAIYDQYQPVGAEGPVPRGPVGAVLGVADRLDTLAAMFAIGEVPTGSKDPFALRRAALAVVKICAEAPLALDLKAAIAEALEVRRGKPAAQGVLEEFLRDRLRFYLTGAAGVTAEAAEAVLAARWGVVPDDVARARALDAVRQAPAFAQLAVAFKRVRNILAKNPACAGEAGELREPAERELDAAVAAAGRAAEGAVAAGDFPAAFAHLAALAAPLDRFFTDVLVMCEDEALRRARLALLARIEALFLRLADLSRLTA
jgi:glycyl-tRNA synthetase beta chain